MLYVLRVPGPRNRRCIGMDPAVFLRWELLFDFQNEEIMMAPFHCPWSTFLAWVVAGVTVIAAVVWALAQGKDQR